MPDRAALEVTGFDGLYACVVSADEDAGAERQAAPDRELMGSNIRMGCNMTKFSGRRASPLRSKV